MFGTFGRRVLKLTYFIATEEGGLFSKKQTHQTKRQVINYNMKHKSYFAILFRDGASYAKYVSEYSHAIGWRNKWGGIFRRDKKYYNYCLEHV